MTRAARATRRGPARPTAEERSFEEGAPRKHLCGEERGSTAWRGLSGGARRIGVPLLTLLALACGGGAERPRHLPPPEYERPELPPWEAEQPSDPLDGAILEGEWVEEPPEAEPPATAPTAEPPAADPPAADPPAAESPGGAPATAPPDPQPTRPPADAPEQGPPPQPDAGEPAPSGD